MKTTLSKDILKKIQQEQIRPVPKKIFIFKQGLVLCFLSLSIVVGALALAISFGYFFEADWFLQKRVGVLILLSQALPLFWGIFLLLSLWLGYWNLKHTPKGYKFYSWQLILGNIVVSLLFGSFLYLSGISQSIEGIIQRNIPHYSSIFVGNKESRMVQVWQNEEKGLLIGQIEKLEENSFLLKDSNAKIWRVNLSSESVMKKRVKLSIGEKVKIIGEKVEENIFRVIELRPYFGKY